MSAKPVGEELSRRSPRLIKSLVMAAIFWIISRSIPSTVSGFIIPGLGANAGTLVGIITWLFTAIFLIQALSDALVPSDIVADIIAKRLGIKKSSRKAARDTAYIVDVILVATTFYPLLGALKVIGCIPTIITMYITHVLIYDMGRILYGMIKYGAESVADRLARMTEKEQKLGVTWIQHR